MFWASDTPAAAADRRDARPNILIIYTDDQRWDSLGIAGHPFLKTPHIDRIGLEGAQFSSAFTTSPVCSPSRASFLTGQYKHTHGVLGNEDSTALSHRLNTFPKLLQAAGYRTGYFGKWHMGISGEPRPGFNRWVSVDGQGKYIDPPVNIDGRREQAKGYFADIMTDHAAKFIEEKSSQPFCVVVAHKGPHSPFTPAPRHATVFSDQKIERRPNSRDDLTGKPALRVPLPGWPKVGPGTGPGDDQVREQLGTLLAIDESVGRLLALLERRGELDRTFVLFTSDHGYFWGEHGLGDKRAAYEEALRVPLLVRYPPLTAAGTISDALVLNIDVAPTMLSLAGLSVPPPMQGKSFLPLLGANRAADPRFRTSFLAEYSQEADQPRIPTWRGVRTAQWKYIHYPTLPGMDELYDLAADPLEMHNLAIEPEKIDDLRKAEDALTALLAETKHPGRYSRHDGILIDRWQVQNVRNYEEARKRTRGALLTDGNFNSGFCILLPDGKLEPIDDADSNRVLAFLEQDMRDSDLRVVATFYDQGEGRRLVSLSPVLTDAGASWEERDGIVAMEAERARRMEGFQTVGSPAASGGFAMQVDESVPNRGGTLEFPFQVQSGGQWYLWMRTQARHHRQNGISLQLNGKPLSAPPSHKIAGSSDILLGRDEEGKRWDWDPHWQPSHQQREKGLRHEGPIMLELTPGEHVLTIVKRLRERPLVDKIVLTRTAEKPTGLGPKETLMKK